MLRKTYANAFDRMIDGFINDCSLPWEYIASDVTSANPAKNHRVGAPHLVRVMIDQRTYADSSDPETDILWNGTQVYFRKGDYTHVCRPGVWVWELYEFAAKSREADERSDLQSALEEAMRQTKRFASVDLIFVPKAQVSG
jgi:hypothetical protein